MNKFTWLFLFTFMVHGEETQLPKIMTFTYVDHPTMTDYLIPLIRSTYQKLGIKTDFVVQPSNRNLRLLNDNVMDGDVGYLKSALTDYHNLFTVEPSVVSASYTLLCQPEVTCTKSVLIDKKQILVSTVASQNGFISGYKGEIKSRFYTINDLSLIPSFILRKRFKYALYPITEQELWRIKTKDFRFIKLHEFNLYHVLNKKYAFMADKVSSALHDTLNEFSARQPN